MQYAIRFEVISWNLPISCAEDDGCLAECSEKVYGSGAQGIAFSHASSLGLSIGKPFGVWGLDVKELNSHKSYKSLSSEVPEI